MKLNTYSTKGTKKSTGTTLPKKFEVKENSVLLAQAIRVYENRLHPGLSKTKTRGEISLTTKKWYRQKGTGGARHGAKSAPIFVGGSKAHGPKGVKRVLTLSKNMRQKALAVAMSMKAKEGKMVAVDGFSALAKTKETSVLLEKLIKAEKSVTERSRFTFALSEKNKSAGLAIRNLKNAKVMPFRNLNAYNVYFGGVIVIDREALVEKVEKAETKKQVKITKKENKK